MFEKIGGQFILIRYRWRTMSEESLFAILSKCMTVNVMLTIFIMLKVTQWTS